MDLFHPGTPSPPSLEARVRVVADIAGALIQIHDNAGLPRAHRRHGRLTPRHLLIGVDGSASLFTAREPFSKLLPPQPDLGYLAPELLTQSGPATQQSDVFSLGVLLWEALDNGRLFPHRRAAAISRLIARRSLPAPRIEDEWALPLGDVAMKALSQNPEDRHLDGTAFWLALREHLPAPDAARQVLSRLAQRALKLELTTDIRDEPPYLSPRVIGLGASVPPMRSSFDEEPELEAPARYSLHPERSSRHSIQSPPPPDAAAWGLSQPPPRSPLFGAEPTVRALAAPGSRSRPPSAKTTASEPPAAQRPSAPSVTPRARYSQPPAPSEANSPISTLHVNLPRELIDASLPFYVSSQPASRAFPWGALSFAALIFFGVGAAVAFGAVTALRTPSNPPNESAPPAAPIAAPSLPSSAAPISTAVPEKPVPAPEPPPVAEAAIPAAPAPPATALPPLAHDPDAPPVTADGIPQSPAAKTADTGRSPTRRAKPPKSRRPKPVAPAPVPVPEEATVVPPPEPEPEPSTEIIREIPGDTPPVAPSAPSGESDGETPPPADLPFVDQPY